MLILEYFVEGFLRHNALGAEINVFVVWSLFGLCFFLEFFEFFVSYINFRLNLEVSPKPLKIIP